MKTENQITLSNAYLLSRKQLAERWSCCKETVKRMQRRGELPAVIFSGCNVRYQLCDVLRIEQERLFRSRPLSMGKASHA